MHMQYPSDGSELAGDLGDDRGADHPRAHVKARLLLEAASP
jgi:hypothetical protein